MSASERGDEFPWVHFIASTKNGVEFVFSMRSDKCCRRGNIVPSLVAERAARVIEDRDNLEGGLMPDSAKEISKEAKDAFEQAQRENNMPRHTTEESALMIERAGKAYRNIPPYWD